MNDWLESLTDEERAEWHKFIRHVKETTIPGIESSAFIMSLVPADNKADVKFAVELGMSIMLDKPIVAVVTPGQVIPEKLRIVADEVVYADIATDQGRNAMLTAINMILERYK